MGSRRYTKSDFICDFPPEVRSKIRDAVSRNIRRTAMAGYGILDPATMEVVDWNRISVGRRKAILDEICNGRLDWVDGIDKKHYVDMANRGCYKKY